jgi:4a-hydroxytetrahydrobiopterin dehydratase
MKCTACRGDEPVISESDIAKYKPFIPEWQLIERGGVRRLERAFKFDNFAQALSFTDRVGALAEREGHHPSILTEWGRVTVTWWTHKINGLHFNDFIMASQTDVAFKAMGKPPAGAV